MYKNNTIKDPQCNDTLVLFIVLFQLLFVLLFVCLLVTSDNIYTLSYSVTDLVHKLFILLSHIGVVCFLSPVRIIV
jgi:hypothetical protein